jgi:hypothetical protein
VIQAEKAYFKEGQFIIKVSLVLLVPQHQAAHFLIMHRAQMSLPGGITCQAPTGMVLPCWCDLTAIEHQVYMKATQRTRNFQLKLFKMTGTGQFTFSLNV